MADGLSNDDHPMDDEPQQVWIWFELGHKSPFMGWVQNGPSVISGLRIGTPEEIN
jgi:hypothetical protein